MSYKMQALESYKVSLVLQGVSTHTQFFFKLISGL